MDEEIDPTAPVTLPLEAPKGFVFKPSAPAKCVGCRRMFYGANKPGSLMVKNGKITFKCNQCFPQQTKKG
jgi:hypothetical protein